MKRPNTSCSSGLLPRAPPSAWEALDPDCTREKHGLVRQRKWLTAYRLAPCDEKWRTGHQIPVANCALAPGNHLVWWPFPRQELDCFPLCPQKQHSTWAIKDC